MRRHLADEVVFDLAERAGTEADRAHVAACAACAARVEEARETLALARRADVPEPSPLYWEALRRNVGRRIAGEPARRARRSWLFPLLAAAAAVVVFALSTGRTHAPAAAPTPTLPAWTALPEADDDPSLPVLEAVAREDREAFAETGGVGAFLAGLSDDESRALAASLRRGQGGES